MASGKKEFAVFFIPFLIIGLAAIYFAVILDIFILFRILLGIIGGLFIGLNAFAVLVELVNWKYYKE